MSFGNEPLSVPDTLIEGIRQRLAAAPVQPVFQPGQDLRVNAGVFNGLDASRDRPNRSRDAPARDILTRDGEQLSETDRAYMTSDVIL